jgi:hypothetical protein
MLRVYEGDRGPRVVLLQILLNRKGADLNVDGVFGPSTRKAVIAFQKQCAKVTATGKADDATWPPLFQNSDVGIIDAYDVTDARYATGAESPKDAGIPTIETGGMCNGVQSVVQQVIQQAGQKGSIAILRMFGHGNHGTWFTFSVGDAVHLKDSDPQAYNQVAAETHSYVDFDHLDDLIPILDRLTPYFAPFGSFEHHGCSLGSVDKTKKMMKRLADLWSVPVTTGIGLQYIPYDKNSAFRFTTQTVTAYPDHDNLRIWAKFASAGETMCR